MKFLNLGFLTLAILTSLTSTRPIPWSLTGTKPAIRRSTRPWQDVLRDVLFNDHEGPSRRVKLYSCAIVGCNAITNDWHDYRIHLITAHWGDKESLQGASFRATSFNKRPAEMSVDEVMAEIWGPGPDEEDTGTIATATGYYAIPVALLRPHETPDANDVSPIVSTYLQDTVLANLASSCHIPLDTTTSIPITFISDLFGTSRAFDTDESSITSASSQAPVTWAPIIVCSSEDMVAHAPGPSGVVEPIQPESSPRDCTGVYQAIEGSSSTSSDTITPPTNNVSPIIPSRPHPQKGLSKYWMVINDDSSIQCRACSFTQPNTKKGKSLLQNHHREKHPARVGCPLCPGGKYLKSEAKLNEHMKWVHRVEGSDDSRVWCAVCEVRLSNPSNRKVHEKSGRHREAVLAQNQGGGASSHGEQN